MKVLVQRVTSANVKVNNKVVGEINRGILLFVGFTQSDTVKEIDYMVDKVINLRIFDDENGVMNKSLLDAEGSILSVSQFTLYADSSKGRRPSYINALNGDKAIILYDEFNKKLKEKNYDEEDLNRPLTGDCSLGIDHGENYCCSQHNYMEKLTNIYVLYDENYFGPGYFIVTEYNKEPVILIKMFIAGSKNFPEFKLFAYEKESNNYSTKLNKSINLLSFKKNNEDLYQIVKLLSSSLPYDTVLSAEYNKEKSSIHISITEDYADITISKDIVSNKDNKDSINITLGDPYTCKNYIQLSTFYNRLAKLSKGVLKDEGMKKILKIK